MRDDAYRVAYEEANAELQEILNQIEQLQQRQSRLERVAEVLKPLADSNGAIPYADLPPVEIREETLPMNDAVPAPVQDAAEPAAVAASQFAETSGDPFQRRINNALRQGFGSGDGREYSRLFSGLSRGH